MTVTLQISEQGNVTIPNEFRQKYALHEGDIFTLVDLGDGSFLLTPKISLVPKLVSEMEAIREDSGVSLEEMLQNLSEERTQRHHERHGNG